MHRLAAMASFLAAMLLLLSLPAAVHGKNMKFSRTLSFNDNLGDALKDLVGDLKNSEKANKGGGQCTFKCENGERATKRANYFPVSDGCMVASFDTEIEGYDNAVSKASWEAHGITECCNAHDTCYGTCGKPKKTCDRKLVDCMIQKCEQAVDGGDQCMTSARHMEEYSQAAGCGEYMRLQKDGCDCKDDHRPEELAPPGDANKKDAGAAAEVGEEDNKKKYIEEEAEQEADEDKDEAAAIEAQMKRDKAKEEAQARKNEAAKQIPKMSIPADSKAIPGGRYCAKVNAMGMFNVEVNLDVQRNNAFTFEAYLNGNNVVPKCRGNKYKFDKTNDSLALLSVPYKQCYRDTLKKYMLQDVKFKILFNRQTEVITVDATGVPLINQVSLEFSKQGCFEDAKEIGGFGDQVSDFALHDDSEL